MHLITKTIISAYLLLFTAHVNSNDFYIGAEYIYNVIKFNSDANSVAVDNYSRETIMEMPYSDHYHSGGIYFGYQMHENIAIELGFAKSRTRNYNWRINTDSNVNIKSLRAALIGNYALPFHPKLQLLGSLGALVKKIDSKVYGDIYNVYTCDTSIDDIVCLAVVNPTLNTVKYPETNTRLQLGLGAQYQWTDHISTRLLVNRVTSPYDFSRGNPYSWNMALQYHF